MWNEKSNVKVNKQNTQRQRQMEIQDIKSDVEVTRRKVRCGVLTSAPQRSTTPKASQRWNDLPQAQVERTTLAEYRFVMLCPLSPRHTIDPTALPDGALPNHLTVKDSRRCRWSGAMTWYTSVQLETLNAQLRKQQRHS